MTDDIPRYDFDHPVCGYQCCGGGYMAYSSDGSYVKHEDHLAITAERDALLEVLATMKAVAAEAYLHWDKDDSVNTYKCLTSLYDLKGISADHDKKVRDIMFRRRREDV